MESEVTHTCEVCERAFSTVTGLGLHRRRAHPVEFDRGINVDRCRRRWALEELQLLAENEARLVGEGVRQGLALRLVGLSQGRTLDSIKGVRKRADYIQLVATALSEGPAGMQPAAVGQVGDIGGADGGGWKTALRGALRSDLDALVSSRWGPRLGSALTEAVGKVLEDRDPSESIVQWWRSLAGENFGGPIHGRGLLGRRVPSQRGDGPGGGNMPRFKPYGGRIGRRR